MRSFRKRKKRERGRKREWRFKRGKNLCVSLYVCKSRGTYTCTGMAHTNDSLSVSLSLSSFILLSRYLPLLNKREERKRMR
jgi:hypothetical protein